MFRRVVFAVLMLGIAVAASAQSHLEKQRQSMQLRVQVSTDQLTYKLGDSLRLETQLVNAGNGDAYIYSWDMCWNAFRGLSLKMLAPDGSLAHGTVLFDCVPPPPNPENVYEFIPLEPGRVYGRLDTFRLTDLVRKPGQYRLEVTFSSSLSRKWLDEEMATAPIATLPVWTMEQPPLKSNAIQLTVTR